MTALFELAMLKIEVVSNRLWKQHPITLYDSAHSKIWREFWDLSKMEMDGIAGSENQALVHEEGMNMATIETSLTASNSEERNGEIDEEEERDTNNNSSSGRSSHSSPHSVMQELLFAISSRDDENSKENNFDLHDLPDLKEMELIISPRANDNLSQIKFEKFNQAEECLDQNTEFYSKTEPILSMNTESSLNKTKLREKYEAAKQQLEHTIKIITNGNGADETLCYGQDSIDETNLVSAEDLVKKVMLKKFVELRDKLKRLDGQSDWDTEFIKEINTCYHLTVDEIYKLAVIHGIPVFQKLKFLQNQILDSNNSNNNGKIAGSNGLENDCINLNATQDAAICNSTDQSDIHLNEDKNEEEIKLKSTNKEMDQPNELHDKIALQITAVISPTKIESAEGDQIPHFKYDNPFDPKIVNDFVKLIATSSTTGKEHTQHAKENMFLKLENQSSALLEYAFAKHRMHVVQLGRSPQLKHPLAKIDTNVSNHGVRDSYDCPIRIPIMWDDMDADAQAMICQLLNSNLRCLWAMDLQFEDHFKNIADVLRQNVDSAAHEFTPIFDIAPYIESENEEPINSPRNWLSKEDLRFLHSLVGSDKRPRTKRHFLPAMTSVDKENQKPGKNMKFQVPSYSEPNAYCEHHVAKRKLWGDRKEYYADVSMNDSDLGVTYLSPKRTASEFEMQRSIETNSLWNNEALQKGFDMAANITLYETEEDMMAPTNLSDSAQALRKLQREFEKRDLQYQSYGFNGLQQFPPNKFIPVSLLENITPDSDKIDISKTTTEIPDLFDVNQSSEKKKQRTMGLFKYHQSDSKQNWRKTETSQSNKSGGKFKGNLEGREIMKILNIVVPHEKDKKEEQQNNFNNQTKCTVRDDTQKDEDRIGHAMSFNQLNEEFSTQSQMLLLEGGHLLDPASNNQNHVEFQSIGYMRDMELLEKNYELAEIENDVSSCTDKFQQTVEVSSRANICHENNLQMKDLSSHTVTKIDNIQCNYNFAGYQISETDTETEKNELNVLQESVKTDSSYTLQTDRNSPMINDMCLRSVEKDQPNLLTVATTNNKLQNYDSLAMLGTECIAFNTIVVSDVIPPDVMQGQLEMTQHPESIPSPLEQPDLNEEVSSIVMSNQEDGESRKFKSTTETFLLDIYPKEQHNKNTNAVPFLSKEQADQPAQTKLNKEAPSFVPLSKPILNAQAPPFSTNNHLQQAELPEIRSDVPNIAAEIFVPKMFNVPEQPSPVSKRPSIHAEVFVPKKVTPNKNVAMNSLWQQSNVGNPVIQNKMLCLQNAQHQQQPQSGQSQNVTYSSQHQLCATGYGLKIPNQQCLPTVNQTSSMQNQIKPQATTVFGHQSNNQTSSMQNQIRPQATVFRHQSNNQTLSMQNQVNPQANAFGNQPNMEVPTSFGLNMLNQPNLQTFSNPVENIQSQVKPKAVSNSFVVNMPNPEPVVHHAQSQQNQPDILNYLQNMQSQQNLPTSTNYMTSQQSQQLTAVSYVQSLQTQQISGIPSYVPNNQNHQAIPSFVPNKQNQQSASVSNYIAFLQHQPNSNQGQHAVPNQQSQHQPIFHQGQLAVPNQHSQHQPISHQGQHAVPYQQSQHQTNSHQGQHAVPNHQSQHQPNSHQGQHVVPNQQSQHQPNSHQGQHAFPNQQSQHQPISNQGQHAVPNQQSQQQMVSNLALHPHIQNQHTMSSLQNRPNPQSTTNYIQNWQILQKQAVSEDIPNMQNQPHQHQQVSNIYQLPFFPPTIPAGHGYPMISNVLNGRIGQAPNALPQHMQQQATLHFPVYHTFPGMS